MKPSMVTPRYTTVSGRGADMYAAVAAASKSSADERINSCRPPLRNVRRGVPSPSSPGCCFLSNFPSRVAFSVGVGAVSSSDPQPGAGFRCVASGRRYSFGSLEPRAGRETPRASPTSLLATRRGLWGLYRLHVREIFSISLYQIQPISNGMIVRIGMG